MDYSQAGVSIERGDNFVASIKKMVQSTYTSGVKTDLGGFCAVYDQGDRYLTSSTDGVGTKIKLAIETDKHDTIGIDLVAMCVNDLICSGSTPLFFLDYIATAKIDEKIHHDVVKGIVEGCKQSGMALVGGETAEMPDMYSNGHYDLAGFSVGDCAKDKLITGENIKAGDTLCYLPSSGFHSNGFSLVRKLIKNDEKQLKLDCLAPTIIYVKDILNTLKNGPALISGMANITGGGVENISRMNPSFKYQVETPPKIDTLPRFMQEIIKRSNLSDKELYRTFNMGMGMVLAVKDFKRTKELLPDLHLLGCIQ